MLNFIFYVVACRSDILPANKRTLERKETPHGEYG